ncbi:MAG: pentapeptide repeat-containing protein [Synechococcus sp. ArSW.bin.68]
MQAESMDDLIKVLQDGDCRNCRLADADLVHADLRDADLRDARLQRANLGEARLDGADLRGANLSFTSLRGASLRGANLEGSILHGTDLRYADLSGARLSQNSLGEAHWQGATGISRGIQSHASLHNAGVEAAQAGRWSTAEQLFSYAIHSRPEEPLSWVARGISRSEQAKDDIAAADFRYAASLYAQSGQKKVVEQLQTAADGVQNRRTKGSQSPSGNGWGGQILNGITSLAQTLAPLAMKALIPMGL